MSALVQVSMYMLAEVATVVPIMSDEGKAFDRRGGVVTFSAMEPTS